MGIMNGIRGMGQAIMGMFGGGSPGPGEAPTENASDVDSGQQQPLESSQDLKVTGEIEPLSEEARKRWKRRLEVAADHHRPYWDAADLLKQEYLGPKDPSFKVLSEGAREGKPVNLVASFVNTLGPQVMPTSPWPLIEARKPGEQFVEGAKRMESRLRDVFDRVETQQHLRRVTFDAFFFAGFGMTGWQPNTSARVSKLSKKNQENGTDLGIPVPVPGRAAVSASNEVKPDEPFVRHLPYRTVRVDPHATFFGGKRWIAYEVDKELEELQAADEKYGGIYHDTDKVRANAGGEDGDTIEDLGDDEKQAKVFTIFHQGRSEGEIGVLVLAGADYTEIRHVFVQLGTEGFPVRMLSFHDATRLFPASPLQFWFDLADSFNEFVAEATERASQHKRITVVPDEELQAKVADAKGGDILVSKDAEAVRSIEVGGTTQDTWAAMQTYERLCDKISGVTDARRGVGMDGSQTATATALIAKFSQSRVDDYANCTNKFLRQIARDAGGLLLTHQWQDVPVKIDEGGQEFRFAMFNNREVPGPASSYDYDFDVSDQERVNPAIRQKRAQDTLTIVANPQLNAMAAQEGRQISVAAALEDLLEANGVRDVRRYIKPLPTPQEIAQQQQQQAMMETQQMAQTGQVLPVNAQGDAHHIHIQVHSQANDAANAEHMAEHFGILEAMDAQPAPGPGVQQQGGQGPAVLQRNGPVRATSPGIRPQGEAELTANASQLG